MNSDRALDVSLWVSEMKRLRLECSSKAANFAESGLRRAYHLAKLSPRPISKVLLITITDEQLDELIARGEWGEALRSIVSNGEEVSVSLSPHGHYLVHLAWLDEMIQVEARSPVLAILCGWLELLTSKRPASDCTTKRRAA